MFRKVFKCCFCFFKVEPSPNDVPSSPAFEKGSPAEAAEVSGLERIRGILRRKSSENAMEMKGILRSKSPSSSVGSSEGPPPPKSILKRKDSLPASTGSSSSSSSSEDVRVSAENDLAARMLDVEMAAKVQHQADEEDASAPEPMEEVKEEVEEEEPEVEEDSVISSSSSVDQPDHSVATPTELHPPEPEPILVVQTQTTKTSTLIKKETIVVESEGSSSGTETTTTVTLRLGSSAAGSTQTTLHQTQTQTQSRGVSSKSHAQSKAGIHQVGGTSLAERSSGSEEDSSSSTSAEVKTTVSLRLAALQKNGDGEWRKRDKAADPGSEMKGGSIPESPSSSSLESEGSSRPSSIADRLKILESAQQGWKRRVNEPDSIRFTVAGKMGQRSPPPQDSLASPSFPSSGSKSPAPERKKKTPKPILFRGKIDPETMSLGCDWAPNPVGAEAVTPAFSRSTSDPNGTEIFNQAAPFKGSNTPKVTKRVVSVPRPDDETFTSFYSSSVSSLSLQGSVTSLSTAMDITDEDFDRVVSNQNLIVERRQVQIQRRRATSRNPVKSLILRTDLQDMYEEINTDVAERELVRMKVEKLAKSKPHLAVEALAGLASKEDFAAVSLKSAQTAASKVVDKVYLLHIKGRRHVQTRLVEPVPSSINSGDCYVLVTSTDVIQWMGQYSNVIEKAKCNDVAQRILLKKDLGCIKAEEIQIIDEEKAGSLHSRQSKRFWELLGCKGEPTHSQAGPPNEDEGFETDIIATNLVYEVHQDKLVPSEQYWGALPQTDMLQPKMIFVFDFGSEMYVWTGKNVPLEARRRAVQLGKDLWAEGYDYSECELNPINHQDLGSKKGKERPAWAHFGQAKHHMEPILFREKFLDWPDTSRLIRVKSQESQEDRTETVVLVPYDAQLMIQNQAEDPDLELEGSHLGRGVEYFDKAERRLAKISSLSVKAWRFVDSEKVQTEEESMGQFHSGDTYIIRWQYRITVTGRDLKGQPSTHGLLGRDRFCYFIWHGSQAPPIEQGTSALTTVELDEERGPHVRLQQGTEPPAFVSLFQGRMVIHDGKRGDSKGPWRLYYVRGEADEEANLIEVERGVAALRSRGALLLVHLTTGLVYVWMGAKSLKHTRRVAAAAASALGQHRPPEFGFHANAKVTIKEQFEGAESRDFWDGLGGGERGLYHSLSENSNRFDYSPRLFHLASLTGQFLAEEVASQSRMPQQTCPYPFLQRDLYGMNQPALMMLDDEETVWLWQGWWPDDTEHDNTGSAKLRWAAERRCAMETVLHYCRLKSPANPPAAYLVTAGLEPLDFVCLFPDWHSNQHVTQLNVQEGSRAGEKQSIQEVLERLKRTTYSLAELQIRPLPEGVDPTRLESYLTDYDFNGVMKMSKSDFYALPAWKQSQLRKETGLF